MNQPFGKNGGPVNKVPRNTFDLSFMNHFTTKFGLLTPVLCKEVIPGDSFKIDTQFGLRFMPTAFPVQTPINAYVHYFYVRNRNLWKDWPDFIGKTKDGLVPPYIDFSPGPGEDVVKDMFRTCGLADYLGVPTTLVGDYGSSDIRPISSGYFYHRVNSTTVRGGSTLSLPFSELTDGVYSAFFPSGANAVNDFGEPSRMSVASTIHNSSLFKLFGTLYDTCQTPNPVTFRVPVPKANFIDPDSIRLTFADVSKDSSGIYAGTAYRLGTYQGSGQIDFPNDVCSGSYTFVASPDDPHWELTFNSISSNSRIFVGVTFAVLESYEVLQGQLPASNFGDADTSLPSDWISNPGAVNPFHAQSTNGVPISALPFRAYESIYNAFYRDERNNPFLIDGQKEYNRFIPNNNGGPDGEGYPLRFRNWEQDFLTTAVPTPQQGDAPLVGISSTGVMSIEDPESGQIYHVQAKTADDADTIVGMDVTENLPKPVLRSLVNYASSGISINDFRNVNAFQRWLETNIRRGFKYRDQIKSHYNVDISYQELDMPEFIGGAHCQITPATVDQTASMDGDPLGSYAGQLYGFGKSNNSVNKYFDEHGFVIGILSIVPSPIYSQLLPKFYLKRDPLDYYFPEFGHIGLQPITNAEVSPVQTAQVGQNPAKVTFGYQRAHYDYLQSTDEVHGLFRTDFRDFVLNRTFDNAPVLSPSFTVVDPDQLNEVFTITDYSDKILGQISFDIRAKRPIPQYGVPRLEA